MNHFPLVNKNWDWFCGIKQQTGEYGQEKEIIEKKRYFTTLWK